MFIALKIFDVQKILRKFAYYFCPTWLTSQKKTVASVGLIPL